MNKRVIILGILVVALFAGLQATYIIREGYQGVVFQFGQHVVTRQDAGLYIKLPFVQDVIIFEKRVLGTEPQGAEYLSLDKKRLLVDHVSRWQITDPLLFYRTVRNETSAAARLDQIIAGRLREEIARHDFIDIVRLKREDIMATVTEGASEVALRDFGITLLDVRIQRIDLPTEVQASVFGRMEAERQRIAHRYRAEGEERAIEIRAEADKQREIILANAYQTSEVLRGEADADAAAITAQAFGQDLEFYSLFRRLQVYKNILGSQSTVVLPPNSDLLRYLESPVIVSPSDPLIVDAPVDDEVVGGDDGQDSEVGLGSTDETEIEEEAEGEGTENED
ncbi:MAG: protease modulator HflC [Anaerolineales bacterium]|nr:protease modulator HflC [Anaerolineales bacterium]